MAKLKLNTSRLNAEQLIAKADLVLPKIAPAPPKLPPVPDVEDNATRLKLARDKAKATYDAYEAAKAALPGLMTARDEAAEILREEHAAMGSALEAKTRDPVALSATGYELAQRANRSSSPPAMIENLKLTAGDEPQTLIGSFDPDALAYTYEVQLTTGDSVTGPWTTVMTPTTRTFKLTGLTSGQRVWVRVRGVGTNGPGPWSDPFTKIVP